MKSNLIFLLSIGLVFISSTDSLASGKKLVPQAGIPSCPAVYNGQRLEISPPLITVSFANTTESELVSEKFRRNSRLAANVLSYFEDARAYKDQGGGRATYSGISKLDGLSIGQFQWNWKEGRGTLIREFMAEMDAELIQESTSAILRAQLLVLKNYASGQGEKDAVQVIVDQLAISADLADSDLKKWLTSNKVKAHQDALVKERMGRVLQLTKTWLEQRQLDDSYFTHVFIFFANLNVHAGIEPNTKGLRDVWIPQLDKFKFDLGGDRVAIAQFISDWMLSCKPLTKLAKKHPEYQPVVKPAMAGGTDAFGEGPNRGPAFHWGNAYRWGDTTIMSKIDDVHFDLFVYGYLFATRSTTTNEGSRDPGWVQLDALNRAGYLALRNGLARGTKNNKGIIFGE